MSKRIIDIFLFEGMDIIFEIAVKYTVLCEQEVLEKNNFEDISVFLKHDILSHKFKKDKCDMYKFFKKFYEVSFKDLIKYET